MAYTKNVWVDQNVQRPKTYEVTNNADGSVTLTDSFGVVTEIGTPVNAVNMNHIENGIADNDTAISTINSKIPNNASSENKMITQEDVVLKLHALKSYADEGELLTDSEGLADVKSYAHSTFDLSKFTVVGSPNITDDGIASGFSDGNYLKTSANIATSISKYEFELDCNITDNTGTNAVFGIYDNSLNRFEVLLTTVDTNKINLLVRNPIDNSNIYNQQIINQSFNSSGQHKFYLMLDKKTNKIILKADDLYIVNNETVNLSTLTFQNNQISLGYVGLTSDQTLKGSIDLKQFSITVDGVPVFSGNRTGIDTIKPDDWTPTNNPNITSDGIYTSTTVDNNNYISLTNFSATNDLTLELEFKLNGGVYESFLIGTTYFGTYGVSGYGTNNLGGMGYLQNGHSYQVKIEYNASGTSTLSIKKDTASTWLTSDGSAWETLPTEFKIGFRYNNAGVAVIDLNKVKIYSQGDLIYQPCLKIPYTESKTGSKIVNAIYRNRVADMAEQFGYANYYTLSDTDFTLPQAELYGLIESKVPKTSLQEVICIVEDYTYEDASAFCWDLSNGWRIQGATQTVTSEGNITVPLLKPFANTSYLAFKNYGAGLTTTMQDNEGSIFSKTVNSFVTSNSTSDTTLFDWIAIGKIA